jgi:hypothetical protein
MNDREIEALRRNLKSDRILLWNPDSQTARQVKSIKPHAEEDNELCAIFANGEYAVLYNCPISDFIVAERFENEP